MINQKNHWTAIAYKKNGNDDTFFVNEKPDTLADKLYPDDKSLSEVQLFLTNSKSQTLRISFNVLRNSIDWDVV